MGRGEISMNESLLNRRDCLSWAILGGASLGLGLRAARAAEPTGKPGPGKIGDFKISLAEWSLHDALFKKKMTNLEFPAVARVLGFEAVEFVNQFFKDKPRDDAYLKDLKKRADDHGVACVLIMIDGEGDLSAPEKAAR